MCIYLCIFVDNDTALLHNSFVLEENVIMTMACKVLDGPEGFQFGYAPQQCGGYPNPAEYIKYFPAWIEIEDTTANVIWIQNNGDYDGMYKRMNAKCVIVFAEEK